MYSTPRRSHEGSITYATPASATPSKTSSKGAGTPATASHTSTASGSVSKKSPISTLIRRQSREYHGGNSRHNSGEPEQIEEALRKLDGLHKASPTHAGKNRRRSSSISLASVSTAKDTVTPPVPPLPKDFCTADESFHSASGGGDDTDVMLLAAAIQDLPTRKRSTHVSPAPATPQLSLAAASRKSSAGPSRIPSRRQALATQNHTFQRSHLPTTRTPSATNSRNTHSAASSTVSATAKQRTIQGNSRAVNLMQQQKPVAHSATRHTAPVVTTSKASMTTVHAVSHKKDPQHSPTLPHSSPSLPKQSENKAPLSSKIPNPIRRSFARLSSVDTIPEAKREGKESKEEKGPSPASPQESVAPAAKPRRYSIISRSWKSKTDLNKQAEEARPLPKSSSSSSFMFGGNSASTKRSSKNPTSIPKSMSSIHSLSAVASDTQGSKMTKSNSTASFQGSNRPPGTSSKIRTSGVSLARFVSGNSKRNASLTSQADSASSVVAASSPTMETAPRTSDSSVSVRNGKRAGNEPASNGKKKSLERSAEKKSTELNGRLEGGTLDNSTLNNATDRSSDERSSVDRSIVSKPNSGAVTDTVSELNGAPLSAKAAGNGTPRTPRYASSVTDPAPAPSLADAAPASQAVRSRTTTATTAASGSRIPKSASSTLLASTKSFKRATSNTARAAMPPPSATASLAAGKKATPLTKTASLKQANGTGSVPTSTKGESTKAEAPKSRRRTVSTVVLPTERQRAAYTSKKKAERPTDSDEEVTVVTFDEVVGDGEMRRFVSKCKLAYADTGVSKQQVDLLFHFPENKRPVPPLHSATARNVFGKFLSEYEKKEISKYPEVYCAGNSAGKVLAIPGQLKESNFGYDDENEDYIAVKGDHLGYRYEIHSLLGKGAFGQVLECLDHKTGQMMAIKVVRNTPSLREQGLVEASVLKNLIEWDPKDTYKLLRVVDTFTFRNHLCIVTDLLSLNLYELIKYNDFTGFSMELVRRFTTQILESLTLLGRHNIVHCDLKPENILLEHPERSGIRVIDFGSSCLVTKKVFTYIQSRFYRSPEVILGYDYGTAIDIWSLGCIVAELLTGLPIFPGDDEPEQLSMIMEVFGTPDARFLARCSRKKEFFDSRLQLLRPKERKDSSRKRRRVGPPGSVKLSEAIKSDDPLLLDFIRKCLTFDPAKRIRPEEALEHPWIVQGKRVHSTIKKDKEPPSEMVKSRSYASIYSEKLAL